MRLDSLLNIGNVSLVLLLAGCDACVDKDDTSLDTGGIEVDTDTDADADTDTDTDVVVGVHGTVNGTVTVSLYEYDEYGNIDDVAWEDTCFGDNFPYGDIFVTAYSTDEKTGVESYYADYTLTSPQTDGSLNTFSFTIDTDEVNEIHLYAVLDKWFNRVIEPSDPMGIYAEPIVLEAGEIVNDINIEILTEYWCGTWDGSGSGGGACPDCPPGWGSNGSCYYWDGTQWVYNSDICGGGGCADGTVTVGGDLDIAVPYNGIGDVGTFLLYPGTESVWWLQPDIAITATEDGAGGSWGFTYCKNAGTYVARGVWDDNDNGLYDPSDTWGQPVDADGNALGSITFGETDEDLTMLIPVGGSDFDLVPFVRLSGTLTPEESSGTFTDLFAASPDASLYIVLGKYRPDGDYEVSDLNRAYDYDEFPGSDLVGTDSVDFSFLAPANTTVFLWASTDLDGDGYINDVDEAWSCYGGEPCTVATGETNESGMSMSLNFNPSAETGE